MSEWNKEGLRELFNSHDYSAIISNATFMEFEFFNSMPFDEIHIISAEEDCDMEGALVNTYGFLLPDVIKFTQLTRDEAYKLGYRLSNELMVATLAGFSCNANGFQPNGWVSMRLVNRRFSETTIS